MSLILKAMMRDILPYIWWKHNIQLLPQALLAEDTLEGVRRAVHVETFLAACEFESYLRKNFRHMIVDQKSFGRFTVFACLLEFESLKNPFDRYIRVLAVAAYFALYLHGRGKPHGVAVLPCVLEKFIEARMSDLTVDKDFMTKLGNHIIRKGYLQHNLEVDRMLREKCSKKDILQAIAKESTINRMKQNGDDMAKVDADDIKNHQWTNEIIRRMDQTVYHLEPRGPPPTKMGFAQKLKVASDLVDDFKKVPMKLNGFERLLKSAQEDLSKELNFREGVLEAPLMEKVPESLILECILNLKDYL